MCLIFLFATNSWSWESKSWLWSLCTMFVQTQPSILSSQITFHLHPVLVCLCWFGLCIVTLTPHFLDLKPFQHTYSLLSPLLFTASLLLYLFTSNPCARAHCLREFSSPPMSGKGPKGIPSGIAWTGQRALSSVTVLRFLLLAPVLVSVLVMMLTGFAKATTSGRVLAGALKAALTCTAASAEAAPLPAP